MLDPLFELSIQITFWLQSLGDWLDPVMHFFTFLGNEEFYLFVMPILVWVVDYKFGLRVGVMLLLTATLNESMKLIFRQPRPYWVDPDVASVASPASGYGVPSGHSQTPLAVFGLMAAIIKKRWFTAVVVFTVFMIGLSRVYLGEHFFMDVLVGWLLGALTLWAYLKLEAPIKAWLSRRSELEKIVSAFVFSILWIFVVLAILSFPAGYQVPAEWLTNAQTAFPEEILDPFTIKNIITSTATLFGLAVGAVWTQAQGGFAASRGAWWQRVLRFVVGLVGVLVFWMGLDLVFPDSADLISYVLRYVRYALVGIWMLGGAVWVFVKLGLGEREEL